MDRRSPPQKRTDDHAFPVRVRILVPERGFENLLLDMHRWLDAAVGRGSFAVHGAGAGLTHATAWYFRTVEEAQAFVAKFPMLEVARALEAIKQGDFVLDGELLIGGGSFETRRLRLHPAESQIRMLAEQSRFPVLRSYLSQ